MKLTLTVIEVVVSDMAASLAFYRRLGLELPEDGDTIWADQPHVECDLGGVRLALDTEAVIRSFDKEWAPPAPGGHRVALAFQCDSPAEVDSAYAELTDSGALVGRGTGHLEPWDAFWGMRYAVVHDPDGTPIDLFAVLEGQAAE